MPTDPPTLAALVAAHAADVAAHAAVVTPEFRHLAHVECRECALIALMRDCRAALSDLALRSMSRKDLLALLDRLKEGTDG